MTTNELAFGVGAMALAILTIMAVFAKIRLDASLARIEEALAELRLEIGCGGFDVDELDRILDELLDDEEEDGDEELDDIELDVELQATLDDFNRLVDEEDANEEADGNDGENDGDARDS